MTDTHIYKEAGAMQTTLGGLFESERQLSWDRYPNNHKFPGQPGLSVTDAYNQLGLNFEVETVPCLINRNGTYMPVPGRHAIVGSVDNHIFGTTGPDYKPLQNAEIAKLLDPFTSKWGVENIAVTNHGRDILTVLKGEPYEVNGESMQEYLWALTSHDGLKAVQVVLTNVRLWCTNQLLTGLRAASFRAQVSHTESVNGELGFQLGAFQMLEQARRITRQSFAEMAKARATSEQIEEFVTRVYPEPSMPKRVQLLHALAATAITAEGKLDDTFREHLDTEQMEKTDTAHGQYEYLREVTKALRHDAKTLIERFNDEHTSLANTPWAMYNAVVELADFRGPARNAVSAAASSLTGERSREKERAFREAMLLVQPNWSDTGLNGADSNLEAATTLLSATRSATMGERAAKRQARQAETAAAREARIKPRYDAEGNLLPPLTVEQREKERQDREQATIAKLEAMLAKKREALEKATQTAEQRLAARKAQAEERNKARLQAILERSALKQSGEEIQQEQADAVVGEVDLSGDAESGISLNGSETETEDEDTDAVGSESESEEEQGVDLSAAEEAAPTLRRGRK